MPGLSLQGLDESAWRRRTDIAMVVGRRRGRRRRRRNGKGLGLLRDVEAMEVQRVMGIPDILLHEPMSPKPKSRTR